MPTLPADERSPVSRRAMMSGLGLSGAAAVAAAATGGVATAAVQQPAVAEAPPETAHGAGHGTLYIEDFHRRRGEPDDTARLQRALDAVPPGGTLVLGPETYPISAGLRWKGALTLAGRGDLTVLAVRTPNVNGIDLVGLSEVVVRGLKVTGTGPGNGTGSGILLTDCTGCRLEDVCVDGFEHQGIVLGGASTLNHLTRIRSLNTVKATAGTGVLLYGLDVAHNFLDDIYATGNRIGVSLNAAHDNELGRIIAHDNAQIGFTIDGINPGEGGRRNLVHSVNVQRNSTPATNWLGGVYLGNESNDNILGSIISKDNQGIGVYVRASRTMMGRVLSLGNLVEGVRIWGKGNSVEQVVVDSTGGDGFRLYQADENHVANLRSVNNGGAGVRVLGARNLLTQVTSAGNMTGVQIETGSADNEFFALVERGNQDG